MELGDMSMKLSPISNPSIYKGIIHDRLGEYHQHLFSNFKLRCSGAGDFILGSRQPLAPNLGADCQSHLSNYRSDYGACPTAHTLDGRVGFQSYHRTIRLGHPAGHLDKCFNLTIGFGLLGDICF
jgi:hypothetical protein